MPDTTPRQMWMQALRSLNFEPLRDVFPDLANMGGYAENYAHSDPESSLVKLRNFAERVVDHVYTAKKLVRAPQSNFADLLNNSSFRMVASDLVLDKLHLLRKLGNRAAHGEGLQASDAVRCVREAWQLARWLTERFTARHRKALIVQATGTGKTRVAIALAKLLIEARWAKRVLFLCARKELRKQAKNAFNDFLNEPLYVIGQANDIGKLDARIYVGIYPGLINNFEDFDVGFFDLVIADESHRSIYNLYGALFKYFDALQIGLTATPVEMVSRSTCQLFGCDYKLPTANYPLEQATDDGNLVPFKVVSHTTKFLRDGIKAKHLTDDQIAALEDKGIDPNTLEFEAKEIDDAVTNKDTNRIILRNLMDNGIRDAEGQLPGKTIIFARNIDHARILASLFDEMYPQFAGKLCRVIHSQEPRAEDLIDQFKGNDEMRIAISVDMLETGIDVPEIVNLVFAKPVKSKVKFWQMIGRGTRLCKNLFGLGRDKTEFQIFDHWGNFAFHDLNAEEAQPSIAKPLTQRRYEVRIDLAARALARSDIPAFDAIAALLQRDAAALPDGAIAVRERWQAVQQARDAKLVHQFAPITRQILLESVAPLMSSLDVRGQGEALRWDLLLCKAQAAAIEAPGAANPHRPDLIAWLDRLPPHLNPVRAKASRAVRLPVSCDHPTASTPGPRSLSQLRPKVPSDQSLASEGAPAPNRLAAGFAAKLLAHRLR